MRLTIEEYFNNFNISKAEIFFKGIKQKYENIIVYIAQYIENDKLIIYNNAIVFEKFSFNGNIIEDKDNKFKPENLSKYFYDYFLYQEKNDIFEYCNHL